MISVRAGQHVRSAITFTVASACAIIAVVSCGGDDEAGTERADGGGASAGNGGSGIAGTGGANSDSSVNGGTGAGANTGGADGALATDAMDAGWVCDSDCSTPCGRELSPCDGSCKDLRFDTANCGACGYQCQPGELCEFGTCH